MKTIEFMIKFTMTVPDKVSTDGVLDLDIKFPALAATVKGQTSFNQCKLTEQTVVFVSVP
jgi:hypothetical protein